MPLPPEATGRRCAPTLAGWQALAWHACAHPVCGRAMDPRLTVQDLACRRGDRLLFRGLSFTLAASQALQVVGANGTGKSSLLRILAGLLRPFGGTVERAGPVALLDGNLPLDEHLPLGQALAF